MFSAAKQIVYFKGATPAHYPMAPKLIGRVTGGPARHRVGRPPAPPRTPPRPPPAPAPGRSGRPGEPRDHPLVHQVGGERGQQHQSAGRPVRRRQLPDGLVAPAPAGAGWLPVPAVEPATHQGPYRRRHRLLAGPVERPVGAGRRLGDHRIGGGPPGVDRQRRRRQQRQRPPRPGRGPQGGPQQPTDGPLEPATGGTGQPGRQQMVGQEDVGLPGPGSGRPPRTPTSSGPWAAGNGAGVVPVWACRAQLAT